MVNVLASRAVDH